MPGYDDTTVAQPFPKSSYRPGRVGRSREGSLEDTSSPRSHRSDRSYESSLTDASSPRPRRLNRSREGSLEDASSPRSRRLDRSRERYPRDGSLDEEYVERRQISRDPKGHLAIRHDELIRRPRHLSRSADPPRRQVTFRDEDKYSRDDSDSDSDYKRSRAVARRDSDRRLKIVPCSDQCNDNPHKPSAHSKSSHHSDTDSDYDSAEEAEKVAKHKNKQLLYTGLACVTTLAAANGIYQNTKAHHARRKEVREGEKCNAEVQRLKNKALLMDVFTVGVVAIGLNNTRMGWKRVEALNKEGKALRQSQISGPRDGKR